MQAPNWTDFLNCSICTNKFNPTDICPVSLSCGHTLCTRCLSKLKTRTCPYDKTAIQPDTETQPPNVALLQLLGHQVDLPLDYPAVTCLSTLDQEHYRKALQAIGELALVLKPLAEHGTTAAVGHLTKPMLKKLVTIVNCQVLDGESRVRALRAARSIADRTVTELLVMHQNQQQISTLLWTAVRNRGCQFLGPVMQEEALKLILRVLESGNSLSRKNIVLFVVQRLSADFPQASKTSIGHVVQLLYRASCFNVEKRDDDSSLMQLKEEFRVYESLRREHDSQIIRMAMEAGLRISPEQWSTLLYGDHKHKSDMQSIIDKLVAQGAASSGLSELIVAIGRSQDPYQLSEKVLPHLETILKLQVDKDCVVGWEEFSSVMKALLETLHGFSAYMQIQSGRFKTGMCPYLSKPGGCPKGDSCTYAHTEEERDKFRNLVRPPSKPLGKPRSGDQFPKNGSLGRGASGIVGGSNRTSRFSGDLGPPLSLDGATPLSSLSSLGSGMHSGNNSLQDSNSPELQYQSHLHSGGLHSGGLHSGGLHSGGDGSGYRFSRRSGPITAPVLPSPDWGITAVPRGVATTNQVYSGPTENGINPYVPMAGGVDYHSNPQHGDPLTYPVTPTPQLLDLDILKLQHEALKQSVEANNSYPKDALYPPVGSSYRPSGSGQQEWLSAEATPSSYSVLSSQHSAVPSFVYSPHELAGADSATIAAAISQQQQQYGHGGHTYSAEQILLSGMQDLHISQTGHDYSVTPAAVLYSPSLAVTQPATSSDTTPLATPTIQPVSLPASTLDALTSGSSTVSAALTAALTSTLQPSSHMTSAPTSAVSAVNSVTGGGGTSRGQEEMEAEIHRLKEQLRESNQTIQHQQAQLHYVPRIPPPPPPTPTPNLQGVVYSHQATATPQRQALYSAALDSRTAALQLSAATETSPHSSYSSHPSSYQPQQPAYSNQPQQPAYSNQPQYSQQQLQAALAVLIGGRGGVAGAGSVLPQAGGSNYYGASPYSPRTWSGNQAAPLGVYSGVHSLPVASNVTPPGTAYLMSLVNSSSTQPPAPQTINPALVAASPLSSRLHPSEHPDDSMLAAYIQMLEQGKAAANPTYHQPQPHPSPYTPTQGQYYYQQ